MKRKGNVGSVISLLFMILFLLVVFGPTLKS